MSVKEKECYTETEPSAYNYKVPLYKKKPSTCNIVQDLLCDICNCFHNVHLIQTACTFNTLMTFSLCILYFSYLGKKWFLLNQVPGTSRNVVHKCILHIQEQ